MTGIIEEFGEERVKELVEKIKKLEQVGVLRMLPFIRENSHHVSEFDEVMSLHAFKRAMGVAEEIGWILVEEGIRGRKIISPTEKGEKAIELLGQILPLI